VHALAEPSTCDRAFSDPLAQAAGPARHRKAASAGARCRRARHGGLENACAAVSGQLAWSPEFEAQKEFVRAPEPSPRATGRRGQRESGSTVSSESPERDNGLL